MTSPNRLAWALACSLLWLAGCGGPQFQPLEGARRYRALPRATRIKVADKPEALPQPTELLGTVVLPASTTPGPKEKAIKSLVAKAYTYGCDALADVKHTTRTVENAKRERYVGPNGVIAYRDVVTKRDVHQWEASCLRTSEVGFEGGRLPPPSRSAQAAASAPAEAPAEAPAAAPAAPAAAEPASAPAAAPAPAPTAAAQDREPTVAELEAALKQKRKEEAEARRAAEQARRAEEARKKEEEEQARAAKAEARKAEAERKRLEKEEAERARREAREAEEARAKSEAERQRQEAERVAQAAAEAEKKRLEADAAEKERQRQAAEEAAKATALKTYEAETKAALASKAPEDQLAWLARYPERDDAPAVFDALQKAAAEANWVSKELVKAKTAPDKQPAEMDAQALAKELADAGAKDIRFVREIEATYRYQVRNASSVPVVAWLAIAGGDARVLVAAGKSAHVTRTVKCDGGGPVSRSTKRRTLEMRFGCGGAHEARLAAIVPADRELAISSKGCGDDATLEGIASVWSKLPTTTMVDMHLETVHALLRALRGETDRVKASLRQMGKPGDDGVVEYSVTLKNDTGREVTAVFDIGTGRLSRLPLDVRGKESITLPLAATVKPDLQVKDVLPRQRTPQWLVGVWRADTGTLVVLPNGKDTFAAYVIRPAVAGLLGHRVRDRVAALSVSLQGGIARIDGEVPGEFARAVLPADMVEACARGCKASLEAALTRLGKYELGGARTMELKMTVGSRVAPLTLTSAW